MEATEIKLEILKYAAPIPFEKLDDAFNWVAGGGSRKDGSFARYKDVTIDEFVVPRKGSKIPKSRGNGVSFLLFKHGIKTVDDLLVFGESIVKANFSKRRIAFIQDMLREKYGITDFLKR